MDLTPDQHRELLDILSDLPYTQTRAGRNRLLQDWPPALLSYIKRTDVPALDLGDILTAAELWPLPDGASVADHPLRLLLQTAVEMVAGTPAAAALQRVVQTLPVWLAPNYYSICPYPGLLPFHGEGMRFFYGRQQETDQLLEALQTQHFILVVGPSGAGKSSLVFAGLLPQIVGSPQYWYSSPGTWLVRAMRPGDAPLTTLHNVLAEDVPQLLRQGNMPQLAAIVQYSLLAHPPVERLLLIVDQAEELFTQATREDQRAFIAALMVLRALDQCVVLLSLRADFYPDLMASDLWPIGAHERVEVAPLSGGALRQTIVEPAAAMGVQVESVLVERLMADAADEPNSLSLLQETLILLWGQLEARTRILTLGAYERLGHDGRSGLSTALAIHADATLANLSREQQILARRIFLRLVTFGEGRPDTGRRQTLAALRAPVDDPALFDQTVATLAAHRLLTVGGDRLQQATTVDLAHDVILTAWPQLHDWITERRSAEQLRRRLEAKAAEWMRLGRGTDGLLDVAELAEAERWLHSADAPELGVSANLLALITASQAAIGKAQHATHQRTWRRGVFVGAVLIVILAALSIGIIMALQLR